MILKNTVQLFREHFKCVQLLPGSTSKFSKNLIKIIAIKKE